MERSMLGLKIKDKIKNIYIRKRTKIIDAAKLACILKWRWAGHIARAKDGRWTEKILHWYPREDRRPRGRGVAGVTILSRLWLPGQGWRERETDGKGWRRPMPKNGHSN
ncbi:jg14717 [Pararge aegeria aegeria]|uniref:Jg14717 protein n=1 Tax=Pararge aegeria aegeria TaxID=348720 RepID=A0A8S4SJ19_9NEOP|nr:jg14717 [Pararge aegeria aegeria]